MTWVLDASAALGLVMGDGDERLSNEVSRRLQQEPAVAPQHWVLEVNNGLLVAARRGRLPHGAALRAQQLLLELPIAIDSDTATRCWGSTFELAQRFELSIYDAAYLEIALRHDAGLATADKALARAAASAGVSVIGQDAAGNA